MWEKTAKKGNRKAPVSSSDDPTVKNEVSIIAGWKIDGEAR